MEIAIASILGFIVVGVISGISFIKKNSKKKAISKELDARIKRAEMQAKSKKQNKQAKSTAPANKDSFYLSHDHDRTMGTVDLAAERARRQRFKKMTQG